MRITNPRQLPGQPMAMDGAKGVAFRLLIGREHGAPNFAMRHFTVEPGGHTPEHRHPYEHEVMITVGRGVVRGGDTLREIHAGDVVFMPANALHQFRNTANQPLEFICLVPLQFDCGNGACQPTPGS